MIRKSIIVAAALLLLTAGAACAQDHGIMITPFYGYQWGGTLKGWDGEARLNSAANFGFILDIPVHGKDAYLELSYSRQVTDLVYREYGTGEGGQELFDIAVEYYQIGGMYTQIKQGPKAFGTMSLGATRFAPQDSVYGSEWLFSAALGIGVIIPVSDRIGLRTHARLLLPFLYSGGGIWCGGSGCSIGVSGGSAVAQGDVVLGLVIRI
jgi:hypothetical protein